MSVSELCTTFITSKKLKDDSERNIIEFAEAQWGLGQGSVPGVPALFPVQKFIFKCSYNIPLDDKTNSIIVKDKFNEKERFRFTETEYMNFLWNEGRINIKEITGDAKDTRPNLLLVIGRRGLKTSSIAVMVSYETYKLLKKVCPQEYYRIMPDDEIRISCIATSQEQASELFRRIAGHLERSDYFRNYRNKPTLGYMQLNTQRDIELYNGSRPSIRIVAAPCSGRTLRGHNNIIAVLDEMAYFFEAETSDDKSDKNIYDSVTPSVAKFNSPDGEPNGRIICISSPAARTGEFFKLYTRSMEKDCLDWLMIQAPTWEVDHTSSSKYLRGKYLENANTYMCEFGAEFSDRVSAWIENEQILRVNIVPGLKEKRQSYERIPHFMGVDVGLTNDGTAIAICHIVRKEVEGLPRDFIELDCIDVRYPQDEDKEHFNPNEMAEWIYTYSQKFFISKGIMDQYYGLSIIPVLHEKGMGQIEAVACTREYNSKVYQNLMSKMLDASLRIPEEDEHVVDGRKVKDLELVRELLKLQATIHSKYMISVEAAEIKPEYSIKQGGYHDDLSDAFARAVYLATEYMAAGGLIKNNVIESTSGSGPSYRKYYLKQKRGAMYTNRPSSALQAEASRQRSMGGMAPLGTRSLWR
jgi:hypothetical protein